MHRPKVYFKLKILNEGFCLTVQNKTWPCRHTNNIIIFKFCTGELKILKNPLCISRHNKLINTCDQFPHNRWLLYTSQLNNMQIIACTWKLNENKTLYISIIDQKISVKFITTPSISVEIKQIIIRSIVYWISMQMRNQLIHVSSMISNKMTNIFDSSN